MLEHTVFVFYILIIFISTIGYGYLFSKIIYNDFGSLNFGYLGIIGFFFLCLISQLSTFFSPHNYLHNLIIHSIGVFTFILLFLSRKSESLQESKKFLVLLLILFIGVYVYKNHDDFPYYHLTYALNLSENKFIIGTGIFSGGFRTPSSLFFFHSLLYLPLIKYYLFHIGPFLILIFFSSAPAINFSLWASISSGFFFPIARRKRSASPRLNPAKILAILITCSW